MKAFGESSSFDFLFGLVLCGFQTGPVRDESFSSGPKCLILSCGFSELAIEGELNFCGAGLKLDESAFVID